MALLYKAVLTPGKLDLLQGWVPTQPWYAAGGVMDAVAADSAALVQVGSYRFDDPAGEVGIETILVQAGDGPVLQVPLTYRSAPLDGADEWLIGTVDHSVLGTRWVYDACGDPVYASVLASIILNGGHHVEQHWEIDGQTVPKPLDTFVSGSGVPDAAVPAVTGETVTRVTVTQVDGSTVIAADGVELALLRRVGEGAAADGAAAGTLTGEWPGQPESQLLARAVLR